MTGFITILESRLSVKDNQHVLHGLVVITSSLPHSFTSNLLDHIHRVLYKLMEMNPENVSQTFSHIYICHIVGGAESMRIEVHTPSLVQKINKVWQACLIWIKLGIGVSCLEYLLHIFGNVQLVFFWASPALTIRHDSSRPHHLFSGESVLKNKIMTLYRVTT